tara:strand:+ start:787 stop:1308 length:522 start_codon:yes stop_codon:yes gene_type:complete
MKKLLLLITVLFFGISTANAQIEKASEGTIYEVMFTPNLEAAGQFALQEGHIVRRTLNGDDTATRWKAHFSFLSVDGDDNDDMTFGLMYGKEKHHDGSTRLATYQGWEGGLLYSDINGNDATAISGGVFVGANYYIANNLYIGTEINFSVALGEETIAMGPGVKGMLTLGWKM